MVRHSAGAFWRVAALSALLTASLVLYAGGQDRGVQGSSAVESAGAAADRRDSTSPALPLRDTSDQKQAGGHKAADVVPEILKMADAGISKEVIKAYVENARYTANPTAADMIALKEHGVPDDVTVVLLKRSAAARAQSSPAVNPPAASVYAAGTDNRYYLDPESYNYFQYYYLYPRTLAFAYDRLGVYPGVYYPPRRYFGFHRGPLP